MYVRLPNGKIAKPDANNQITVTVRVDLSKFIDNDLEGILDHLSEEACGSTCMGNINYVVTGAEGNELTLEVTGDLSIVDVEEIDGQDLPEIEWDVAISRSGVGFNAVRVAARCESEAIAKADDAAGSLEYVEKVAHYRFEAVAA